MLSPDFSQPSLHAMLSNDEIEVPKGRHGHAEAEEDLYGPDDPRHHSTFSLYSSRARCCLPDHKVKTRTPVEKTASAMLSTNPSVVILALLVGCAWHGAQLFAVHAASHDVCPSTTALALCECQACLVPAGLEGRPRAFLAR